MFLTPDINGFWHSLCGMNHFNSPDERKVAVKLYDVCGRLVHREEIEKSKIGMNEILIRPKGLSQGVYFVQMEKDGLSKVEKTALLR
ncbi:MAG: T9SS type A sorting domain-containing protein [bacterium]